jgi:hypothetical protein
MPEGSVRAQARLNANLDPHVVVGQHGWWRTAVINQLRGFYWSTAFPCGKDFASCDNNWS